jgi:hypothetical protein
MGNGGNYNQAKAQKAWDAYAAIMLKILDDPSLWDDAEWNRERIRAYNRFLGSFGSIHE